MLSPEQVIEALRKFPPGTTIPKPSGTDEFKIKGWGKRRKQTAMVYRIPNRKRPSKPTEKGVTIAEWEQAYRQLLADGELTKRWLDSNIPGLNDGGGCNFITVGGMFTLLV